MSTTTATDRCLGVLLGLAAGDRNGGPIRMAVRLAESLSACGRFDPDDVLARYVAWYREGAFDTGPVTERVLELVAAGVPNQDATAQVHREFGGKTAGCNPAHRSPPLAMFAGIRECVLPPCSWVEAQLTHHDPMAGAVAGAVNRLCRSLIRGPKWVAMRPAAAPVRAPEAVGEGPGNNGGYAPDVMRAAAYFVGSSRSFAQALARSIAFAGPANYCPVLVGAIGGARWGASAIPQAALAHVDILPRVRAAAEALAAGWASSGGRP